MLDPRRLALPVAAACGAALLAACGGSETAAVNVGAAGHAAASAGGGGGAQLGVADSGVAAAPLPAQPAPPAGGQGATATTVDIGQPQGKIERRVDASFRVDHGTFQSAFDSVISKATSLGGFVVESSTEPDADGRVASGSVTVRVPADKLSQLVTGFGSSFRLSSIDYSSIDHTSESVDLAARLAAAKGHRDALEQLLSRAQGIQDITSLEDQIAQVQQQIDQIQGQSDAVANAVELATAKVAVTEDGLAPAPPPPSSSPLLDALHTGWSNAVSVVSALVLGVTTILPILLLVVVLAVAARWARRIVPTPAPRPAHAGTPTDSEA